MKVRITRMKSLVSAALVMASPSDHTHTHTLPHGDTSMTCCSWHLLPSSVSNKQVYARPVPAHRKKKNEHILTILLIIHAEAGGEATRQLYKTAQHYFLLYFL